MAQRTRVSPELVCGDVDEGYGKVADAFRLNLASGAEVGAAVAIYRDGRKVVDLWGGFRDGTTRAPWTNGHAGQYVLDDERCCRTDRRAGGLAWAAGL